MAVRTRIRRVAFHGHLWAGVIVTAALLVISVTGILLNHKRGLGLMPDVSNQRSAPFATALPLAKLAEIALEHANQDAAGYVLSDINRMDVRPAKGYVKVRLDNATTTEVTVDIITGSVLFMGRRGDVFLEKLHSGEAFGGRWVLLSDIAAVVLVFTLISGYWLWLAPKLGRAPDGEGPA